MRTSFDHGHSHEWSPGDKRTSYDKGHTHTVNDPKSGRTDMAMQHDHTLPKGFLAKKAEKGF